MEIEKKILLWHWSLDFTVAGYSSSSNSSDGWMDGWMDLGVGKLVNL